MHISIGEVAIMLGVSVGTLRRWDREGSLCPCFRTPGGHRRYGLAKIKGSFLGGNNVTDDRVTLAYARVSSHDQAPDLERQIARLSEHCAKSTRPYKVIRDKGSGLNFKKPGLKLLIRQICEGRVGRLVLTHRDQLVRFGSPLIFTLCQQFDCEVVILDEDVGGRSFEEALAADVIELMTVYSAKVYGRRAHQRRRSAA